MKKLTTTLFFFAALTLTTFARGTTILLCCNSSCFVEFFTLLKDWQTLIAAIIVIIGWFVNSWLNRKAEIAKRRSEHRLTALKSFVDSIIFELSKGADFAFKKPEFKVELELARKNIQMYGYRHEIDIYENFIKAINEQNLEEVNKCIPKLTTILESLRTELGLENYNRQK